MVHPRNSTCGNISTSSSKFANTIKEKYSHNYSNSTNIQNYHHFEQSFMEIQKSIKSQIERYNSKYLEVTDILADMHIKDIMRLNEMLKINEQSFQKCKETFNNFDNVNFLQSGIE